MRSAVFVTLSAPSTARSISSIASVSVTNMPFSMASILESKDVVTHVTFNPLRTRSPSSLMNSRVVEPLPRPMHMPSFTYPSAAFAALTLAFMEHPPCRGRFSLRPPSGIIRFC